MVIKSLYKREYDEFLKPSLVTVTWPSPGERDYKVIMVYMTHEELMSLARLPLGGRQLSTPHSKHKFYHSPSVISYLEFYPFLE